MVRVPLTPAELQRGRRLGALLRSARGERSMVDVAACAGISPETLRKIETGRVATPSFTTIAAICTVLELSLDEVWGAVDERSVAREGRIRSDDPREPAAVVA